ncbi:hypothetical protein [Duganella vulcania]|uniref:Uncharacterized protein n=1 Tax=Duganella vulcania TaxID=2692166 RepID=A0A845GSN2_9BURK|nr:hypothetical protein [Duganella vulcania]MYM97294.1 hypothetical protein [Duganella vulcania]
MKEHTHLVKYQKYINNSGILAYIDYYPTTAVQNIFIIHATLTDNPGGFHISVYNKTLRSGTRQYDLVNKYNSFHATKRGPKGEIGFSVADWDFFRDNLGFASNANITAFLGVCEFYYNDIADKGFVPGYGKGLLHNFYGPPIPFHNPVVLWKAGGISDSPATSSSSSSSSTPATV